MQYRVNINQTCTYFFESEEEYGEWSESFDNTFVKIYPSDKDSWGDIRSPLDIKPGEACHVVWVEYSIGDSFGHSERGRASGIAVFTDIEDAINLKKYIEAKQHDDWENGYNQTWQAKDHEIQFYMEWLGYFEDLNEVHIESTVMQHE